ncbi:MULTISPECIES: hypothetical protein [Pontibacillus]|uniref:DUF4190 domain-containing protein n=1 Tax=Pontibacillus chungwhensis TaxID=265426 RepID=A0ABY8UTI3_9BACI|nr:MULTISPECIES: hypothetical protein [Pontibacillus]MCD5323237.1 hypothetical protein [Pontibacillus sp. HN14]WIF96623.1 hypothetical protein QNI29_12770 [Pontibacillus chungwhensis]
MKPWRKETSLFLTSNFILWIYIEGLIFITAITGNFVNLKEIIFGILLVSAFTGLIFVWGLVLPLLGIRFILKRKKKFHHIRVAGHFIGGWIIVALLFTGTFKGYDMWEQRVVFGGEDGKKSLLKQGKSYAEKELSSDYNLYDYNFSSAMFMPKDESVMTGDDHATVILRYKNNRCIQDGQSNCYTIITSRYHSGKWSPFFMKKN